MAKARRGSKANPLKIGEVTKALADLIENKRSFIITAAAIKDDFCHFSFEITKGIGIGNTLSVKGKHIIVDDMKTAFSKFNAHLACLDDAFKYKGIDITDIDTEHSNELTGNYVVTGFKISGGEGNETITLVGNKYCSQMGGRMEIETGKVPLDNLSSYTWYNELKAAADTAREEVALYQEGKYILIETEDEEPEADPNQTELGYTVKVGNDDEYDQDFANAAL
jgi:hypothetical protein